MGGDNNGNKIKDTDVREAEDDDEGKGNAEGLREEKGGEETLEFS